MPYVNKTSVMLDELAEKSAEVAKKEAILMMSAPKAFQAWEQSKKEFSKMRESIKDVLKHVYPKHSLEGIYRKAAAVWVPQGKFSEERITEWVALLEQGIFEDVEKLKLKYNLPDDEIEEMFSKYRNLVDEIDKCRGEGYYSIKVY